MHKNRIQSQHIIETNEGPICGYIEKSDERTYYKFKKIPYAKPPLGNLRFKPPESIDPWMDVLDCTQDTPKPIGPHVLYKIVGSEDCLYIEVSTPNTRPEKLLPVMFWIGTSWFSCYSDDIYDVSLINDQDIVLVRCGFRTGPFGFLSIKDFSAPGNSGLKDLVMALKWVQRNITKFGGDPKNVTIFGSGTGGAIVHLMILSPMATGLFHKAIIQSASALNRWSIDKNPIQQVLKLAKQIGIKASDKMEIIEELKTIDAKEILMANIAIWEREFGLEKCDLFDSFFKPCIEEEFEGEPVFLNKSPELILKSGKINAVPMIIGSNNSEASVIQHIKSDFYADFEKFNKNPSLIVPKSLASVDGISAKKIGRQLLDFYFRGTVKENGKTQYLQLLSDYHCLYYVNRTIRLHTQVVPHLPIYYYILNFAGDWSVPEELSYYSSMGHFAEIPFLFPIKINDSPHCDGCRDSIITRKRVVKMWTNFAKHGNPTPDENDDDLGIIWEPVINDHKLNYLSIGYELTKGRNPYRDRMLFWDKLDQEHTFLKALLYYNDTGIVCNKSSVLQ